MSHSSTESETISPDAGLPIDGIFSLDPWDVVKEVLHSSNNKKSSTQEAAGNSLHLPNTKFKKKGNQNVDHLLNLDQADTT